MVDLKYVYKVAPPNAAEYTLSEQECRVGDICPVAIEFRCHEWARLSACFKSPDYIGMAAYNMKCFTSAYLKCLSIASIRSKTGF